MSHNDTVHGDKIQGDKVQGDKVTVGDVSDRSNVVIGRENKLTTGKGGKNPLDWLLALIRNRLT